jgi:DNA-binding LacI/PurR family transcriptional regulator
MYERGIRCLHYIAGPKDLYTVNQRIEGCIKAKQELDSQDTLEIIIHHIPLSMMGCYEKTLEILQETRSVKTGIFAYNDNLAMGAMKAIRESGLRIPDDIALAGYDDIRYASMLEVPLTTIRQSSTEIGEQGATLLIDLIKDTKKQRTNRTVILEPELIVRGST